MGDFFPSAPSAATIIDSIYTWANPLFLAIWPFVLVTIGLTIAGLSAMFLGAHIIHAIGNLQGRFSGESDDLAESSFRANRILANRKDVASMSPRTYRKVYGDATGGYEEKTPFVRSL